MNKLIENLVLGIAATAIFVALPAFTFAQNPWTAPPPSKPAAPTASPRPESRIEPPAEPFPRPYIYYRGPSEKSIKVDGSVNLAFGCVSEGTIKVNGWNRNEVRVFVENGTKFGFRILQKSVKSGSPEWIKVVGMDPKSKFGAGSECISAREIEIDAPLNATITIKGREISTNIDSVKRVEVTTIGGDISIRNISGGITASAGQGDITVAGSEGAMMLDTTTGNILVFDAGPSGIGDIFKAKTNSGEIALQRVTHRQINVNSISGSVSFNGEILNGGSYNLGTTKGSIRLALPAATACMVYASYGYGTFNSEIPFKIATENITEGPVKTVVGSLGKGGDAVLKLSSVNGSISIKKQP